MNLDVVKTVSLDQPLNHNEILAFRLSGLGHTEFRILESPCRGSGPCSPGSQSSAVLCFGAADGTPASSDASKLSLATPIAPIL